MNELHGFDDYTVSAWKDRSLMIRLSEVASEVIVKFKSSLAVAAMACTVVASTVLTPSIAVAQTTESSNVHFSFEAADLVDVELESISRTIDRELADLMNFSTIDESVLALANQAVEAMNARTEQPASNWADKMFPEEIDS